MASSRRIACVIAFAVCCNPANADAPPFDRPGIAFSTGTLPAGTFMWEQSAPDVETSSQSDDATTTYGTESRFRAALNDSLEVQLATSFFNATRSHESGKTETADGRGDASIALKAALPSSNERFSWASPATVHFGNRRNRV